MGTNSERLQRTFSKHCTLHPITNQFLGTKMHRNQSNRVQSLQEPLYHLYLDNNKSKSTCVANITVCIY